MINPQQILDRVKKREDLGSGWGTEVRLAKFLGISKENLKQWRNRESFNFGSILSTCESKHYDLHWLLTGESLVDKAVAVKNLEIEKLRKELADCRAQIKILKETIIESK